MVKHARPSLLAIYNPSLGRTEESLRDQIVFYWSAQGEDEKIRAAAPVTSAHNASAPGVSPSTDRQENEKLRQVGLAQGMVDFARTFSDGGDVDTAECERSRVVIKELEPGWWILASIDFACFPVAVDPSTSPPLQPQQIPSPNPAPSYEYSSRDIAPAHLLIQNLLRAHRVFLLHNGMSLDALYKLHSRLHFSFSLSRFWRRFIYNWDVCLSGHPAADVYNGLKLSASGELGVGVGEEEWGSGERCVLEDIIAGNEGMVDSMVARFGDEAQERNQRESAENDNNTNIDYNHNNVDDDDEKSNSGTRGLATGKAASPWLGYDIRPSAADGIVFSGIGRVARSSMCTISHWMEWVFRYGEYAYGIKNDPRVIRPPKSRKPRSLARGYSGHDRGPLSPPRSGSHPHINRGRRTALSLAPTALRSPGIPPPLITAEQQPSHSQQESAKITKSKSAEDIATAAAGATSNENDNKKNTASAQSRLIEEVYDSLGFSVDTFQKLVTLGYGSAWGTAKSPGRTIGTGHADVDDLASEIDVDIGGRGKQREDDQDEKDGIGRFLLGFKGNWSREEEKRDDCHGDDEDEDEDVAMKDIVLRKLTVEMNADSQNGQSAWRDVKAVIYIHRPFMYLFIFDDDAPSLYSPGFYRTLTQYHLNPLHKPLLRSTSPPNSEDRAMALLQRASAPSAQDAHAFQEHPLYDFSSDPVTRTIQTSLPGIPERGRSRGRAVNAPWHSAFHDPAVNEWTRADALNVHMHILSVYAQTGTPGATTEMEKTTKTGRNWWVVWVRDGNVDNSGGGDDDDDNSRLKSHGWDSDQTSATTRTKEAFLIRRSTDGSKSSVIGSPSRLGAAVTAAAAGSGMAASSPADDTRDADRNDVDKSGSGGGGVGSYYYNLLAGGASSINQQTTRLTEGIGVDTRRYIQGLFNSGR